MNRIRIIILNWRQTENLEFCWFILAGHICTCYYILQQTEYTVGNYQYLYKVWIEYELREITLDLELIVILNRWELLLGHVGIWDVWEKCQLVNHCLGAITVLWSLLNSPLTPIVAVCSLTQNLLSTLISLKRNATRKNSKFYFGRYYNISLS